MSVDSHCELVALELSDYKIIIVTLYRSPTGDFSIFLDKLEQIFHFIFDKYSKHKIIITGNFNMNFLNKDKVYYDICDLVYDIGLHVTYYEINRYSYLGNGTCIDNILTCLRKYEYSLKVVNLHISDHLAILFEIKTNVSQEVQTTVGRIYNQKSCEKFTEWLMSQYWNKLYNYTCPNDMLNYFVIIY